MPRPLRVIFAGTPDFAAASLDALLASPHHVVAVYTQPDRPAGRGRKLLPSPVKRLALEHEIEVLQPATLKDAEAQRILDTFEADVMAVAAYGLLLPQAVLDTPRLGCINVHASLLPRWRGAAPIQRAIESGDEETGITIMQMAAGLDTGDMLLSRRTPIESTVTGSELHDRLATLGGEALIEALDVLAAGRATATPQPADGVTYARKLSKAEAQLDFSLPATILARRIRAFNPWPVAWATLDGEPLRLWLAQAESGETDAPSPPGTLLSPSTETLRIACGPDGSEVLSVLRAQLPGGKPLAARELLNARHPRLAPGTRLNEAGEAQS